MYARVSLSQNDYIDIKYDQILMGVRDLLFIIRARRSHFPIHVKVRNYKHVSLGYDKQSCRNLFD